MYWNRIREAAQKEVSDCYTCHLTKLSNKKHGKLPDKVAEEIPQNKICVYIIGPYVIHRKGKKENINLKSVTMIDTITGWFEIE